MKPPTVYITIGNYTHSLLIDAVVNKWEENKIVARAVVENISMSPIPEPTENEYRQWVTQVARAGARALEDALMNRIYEGKAAAPLEFEPPAGHAYDGTSAGS